MESMKDTMEVGTHLYESVDDSLRHLAEGPYQANPPGVGVYLWEEDKNCLAQLRWYPPVLPHVLCQVHQIHLYIWLGGGVDVPYARYASLSHLLK